MQELVALSHIEGLDSTWLERMNDDMESTLAVCHNDTLVIAPQEYIVTEWGFTGTKAGPQMVPLKGCSKQENGGHLR